MTPYAKSVSERALPVLLVIAGVVCLMSYPLHVVWPSGWEWGFEGRHYLQMILTFYAVLGVFLILAARDPSDHRSLILFMGWSSLAHGALMGLLAVDLGQLGHLYGDVPAMLLSGVAFVALAPARRRGEPDLAAGLKELAR